MFHGCIYMVNRLHLYARSIIDCTWNGKEKDI